jgi:drug/metabolite transporter (DMT)-like permease
MHRKILESTAANYPYLQGLWAIPFGFGMMLAGISNLQNRPAEPIMLAILAAGLGAALLISWRIARYYRDHYGSVTPTRDRLIRQGIAIVAWVVILFVGANQFLLWSPDSPMCIYASAFALGILAYYAILVGLRRHHLLIWGAVFVAGLLPIWGSLGPDRDPIAMIPLGLALILSGILDQRLLARSFASAGGQSLETSHVGG